MLLGKKRDFREYGYEKICSRFQSLRKHRLDYERYIDDLSPTYLTTLELKRLINFLDEIDVTYTLFVVPYEEGSMS